MGKEERSKKEKWFCFLSRPDWRQYLNVGAKACLYRQEIYYCTSLEDEKSAKTTKKTHPEYKEMYYHTVTLNCSSKKKVISSYVQKTGVNEFFPYISSIFVLLVRQNMFHAKCVIL